MESTVGGKTQPAITCTAITTTAPASATATAANAPATTTTSTSSSSVGIGTIIAAASSNTSSVLITATSASASASSSSVGLLAQQMSQQQQPPPPPQQLLPMDMAKQDDANNSSLASAMSESQRSLSAAPSASSSPILSPPGKIFGRNANGTLVATSRPSNEAETQLYRVLQRASLLVYYDTLLEMGGDDVQQLYEAGEEEFLEIMALVGMASKPLHVRRLQKALHEWANNPSLFQGPISSSTPGLFDTPTKSPAIFTPEPSPSIIRSKFSTFNPTPAFHPTPLISTSQAAGTSHLLSQICTPAVSIPVIQPHTPLPLPTSLPGATPPISQATASAVATTPHQVTSSSPQLTPVLTEMQVARITLGAEKIARQLPQREPRAQTSKKRTSRELEQVIAMSENDPRRMEEIRKYSAIYGRFDCKRRPEKPLTLHEVCVNEAAAQLCRLVPALLTRRDELFPLARQIVKDAGFGHSATIARYGGLLPQIQQTQSTAGAQRSSVMMDCESSDSATGSLKRQRLSSTETTPTTADLNRECTEDARYNLFAMYQKFAKPPFDLTDINKFSLSKSEYDDNDNDSRLSFSNSSSPSMPTNSLENERELNENLRSRSMVTNFGMSAIMQPASVSESTDANNHNNKNLSIQQRNPPKASICSSADAAVVLSSSPLGGGVQVISAAGGHIIAVANPALALSPTLNEALSLKREAASPEL